MTERWSSADGAEVHIPANDDQVVITREALALLLVAAGYERQP